MRRILLATAVCGIPMMGLGAGATGSVALNRPDKEDTYTITSVMQILQPVNPIDMTDDFQDARVLAQDDHSSLVEVTYYPLYQPPIGENRNWRKDDAGMAEYLQPTPAENWDETMRRDLLAELHQAGIEPEQLNDKELVQKVSAWAMHRTHSTDAFSIWCIDYQDGKPQVFPPLRAAFDKQKPGGNWTDQQMFDAEALGRSMYYNKVHGSCTSSSIYLATVFRALGIPTRIVFCIPPFDPNDDDQAQMFYENVSHNRVRETIRAALDGMKGFDNHLFNEVYIDHRWVRLNYSNLGQPILDAHYFGLLTHIYTCPNISAVPLAKTWGMRYFKYPADQPKLSSINPYRLLLVHDHFGSRAHIDNPPGEPYKRPELLVVTIVGLFQADSPQLPKWAAEPDLWRRSRTDFLISSKEWIKGAPNQMRAFRKHVTDEFILTAPDRPEVRVRLNNLDCSAGDGSFQAYGAQIDAADKDKLIPGVAYSIKPKNIGETYRWAVDSDEVQITFR